MLPPRVTRKTGRHARIPGWSAGTRALTAAIASSMAVARLNLPGLVLYNGSMAPGHFRGKDVTIQDVFEGIGAYAAGKITAQDLHDLESVACPGAGGCGGQFTANTMSAALEFLGISPAGLNGIPAPELSKKEAA